jgi:hypothetical protein
VIGILAVATACAMPPPRAAFELPPSGLVRVDDPEGGTCGEGPPGVQLGGLSVAAEGPEGSGRFWTLTVRHGDRGLCFTASTVGWRTLREFDGPLPWIEDADADGQPELVVWSSFALDGSESAAAQALVAWVYEWDGASGSLRLAPTLSRRWAGRLAAAYRKKLPGRGQELRDLAARRLDELAAGRCVFVEDRK